MSKANTLHKEFKKNLRPCLRMLQGAGLATALLSFSFLSLGNANSEDLRWMILPYILVPAAGALGGLIFHLLQPLRQQAGSLKIFSLVVSLLIYLFLLAVAFILGMNGPN